MKFKNQCELLKKSREAIGMTQDELAFYMGEISGKGKKSNSQLVSNIERGKQGIPPKRLSEFCKAAKCSEYEMIQAMTTDYARWLISL